MAEAGASLIILLVAPLLACDLNYNKDDIMTMNATSSLGMAFGGLLFGTLIDTHGRKETIPVTMIVIFCGSLSLLLAQSFFLINLSVFVIGIGVAGNNAAIRIYLIECLPSRKRGSCLAVIDFLWIVGYLTSLGMLWSLVPSAIKMQEKELRPSSWRVVAGLGAVPVLLVSCVIGLLPLSPRYLIYRRQPERALAVLRQMYAINFSRHADKYQVSNVEGSIQPEDDDDELSDEIRTVKQIVCKCFSKNRQRVQRIFTPPFLRITFLSIVACCLQFPGFIWPALWNMKILNDTQNLNEFSLLMNNDTCISNSGSIAMSFFNNCHQENNEYFRNFLLLSLSFILGELFLIFGVDRFGRRLFLISSGLIGSTAMITFTFVTSHVIRIILSVAILSAFATSYTTVTLFLLENYPTALRGTIMGFARILPHLVGFFMKSFMKLPCLTTLYIASGIMIGTVITTIPIPDLTNAPMQE
ncbi:synaptic vesicle 2-related protein-like [Leptopilina heterotoma]|uniref:synaptic vesicle 2-related protein-like n=1 Tax=Leptopilina heterotoma TaxID=63436 RepID=UPI001CA81787|nr:synaptic vesicle 2-related protein-like [Leptopilina heterotoma]